VTSRLTFRRAIAGATLTAIAAGGTLLGLSAASAADTHPTAKPMADTHNAAAPAAARTDAPDPALATRVATWVSQGGEAQMTTLGTDFQSLQNSAQAGDLNAMLTDCTKLGTDVKAAQTFAPIPDGAAQQHWSAALAAYSAGAADCVAGAKTSNVQLITSAANQMIAGSNSLDKVTMRLTDIAGR
jgi:hypothetical protein